MSTLQATNLKHNASASNNIVLDSSGNATFAGTAAMASSFLRNRIINGDMRIDQRNAGASVTTTGTFPVDRFLSAVSFDGTFSAQRSTLAPSGFTNSLLFTVTSPDPSLGASQFGVILQNIEGFNIADFGWGTATAQTVTLSFWTRSSATGTFGGSIRNSGSTRSYPFNYIINAANTWEYKTIIIPGDTTGTWATDNGVGLNINWSFGAGSTFSGTAGAWAGSNLLSSTGATSILSTNGATFYLTGVQLEVGSVATPFERRQFGQELALCQRYFQRWDFTPTWGSAGATALVATKYSTTDALIASIPTFCPFRVAPTVSVSQNTARAVLSGGGGTVTFGVIATNAAGNGPITISATNNSVAAGFGWLDNLGVVSASAEL